MIVLNLLLYYLFIIPISLLPFRALYLLSDFLHLILYRVFGYRTKVVRMNLRNSFPEKSETQLKAIEENFYHHLCDVIVETLKSFTISEKELRKRLVLVNPQLADHYYEKGQSILIAGGHFNNWEWIAVSLNLHIRHLGAGIYTPLTNAFFERKMRETRGKFGMQLIPTREVTHYFESTKDKRSATVFGIDQAPRKDSNCHWMTFLHQETGVAYGLEKYARSLDYPVLFFKTSKIKRGYYSYQLSMITDHPRQEPEGMIIETATRMLEKQIIDQPEYWLWTHKRWKHKREIQS
jgi:KDO2-lipid IV(A) lauroyltransferase